MMKLTPQQAEASEKIQHFLTESVKPTFGLFGYAGTGKSFITRHLVKNYKGQVFLTASTNKATSVMKYMWKKSGGQPMEFQTVYKLFGYYLNPVYNPETGEWEEKLNKSQTWVPPFETLQGNSPLVIVDEASMIPKFFYEKLLEYIPYFDMKILFIGDPGQLPPVKEDISPVFERIHNGETEDYVMLTDIVRQDKDSDILKVATYVRSNLEKQFLEIPFSNAKTREELAQLAIEDFKGNKNFLETKLVAWRNDTVSWYNNFVRTTLRPPVKSMKECPFVVGDPVIAKKPVYKDRDQLLYTSQEMIVIAIKEAKKSGISTFQLTLESQYEPKVTVHMVKPSNWKTYLSKCKWYKEKAKRSNSDIDWMIYKKFAFGFAELDYSFAITAHKSQGSTYKNTYVDIHDILANSKVVERNKCLYVAVSRPTDKLEIKA